MEKKINIHQIDAFTTEAFTGNPAGVTFAGNLTENEKQLVAREMNVAETAFLSPSDKADYKLQWFTPAVEVKLCGHATIASLHFLKDQGLLKDSITFETLSGILHCGAKNGKFFMQIPVYNMKEYEGDKDEILGVLGIGREDIDPHLPFLLLENGYLYVYVKKFETIKSIKPDFKTLHRLSITGRGFDTVTVFTLETVDKESFAHLRFFAPFYGIDEDPVTGSSNGPLMLVLQKLGFVDKSASEIILQFEQGDIIGRRGRITVSYNEKDNKLFISGNAVTIIKGELAFNSGSR